MTSRSTARPSRSSSSAPGRAVTPPVLSGHAVEGSHQVVLGAATLAQLHKHVGQTVTVSYGVAKDAPLDIPPTRVTIVGTATFPAIGFASTIEDHTSMGTGAWLADSLQPTCVRQGAAEPVRHSRTVRTWCSCA